MDINTLIRQRRTQRVYTKAIEDELLYEILETAVYAPSHHLKEAWRFIVFNNKAEWEQLKETALQQLSVQKPYYQAFIDQDQFYTMLVVITSKEKEEKASKENLLAGAALIQNILLLASAHGIGACWHTEFLHKDALFNSYNITENEEVAGFIVLGYTDEKISYPSKRKGVKKLITRF